MNQRTSVRFRVIVFALTAGMIAFAFIHSAMPASESSKESNSVLAFLSALLSGLGIHRELTGLFVRKLAHFSEYTVIGTLLVSCAYSFDRARPYRYLAAVLFTGLASALTDETIQQFSEGRAGQITDVWLDFSGVLTGTALMLLFFVLYIRIKKRKRGRE